MRVVDLSHVIRDEMQVYPGDPIPSIEKFICHEKDYCHVDKLILGTHTGTHIDAPYHFSKDGLMISDFPIERFIGRGILIDVTGKKEEEAIGIDDIDEQLKQVTIGDFVILKTGWDKYFGTKKYLKHPYLTSTCAEILVKKGVSLVAIDALNVDPTLKEEYPVHDILLGNNVLIVENLCNLEVIEERYGLYSFLPLKLKDTDGSPIRAIYIMKS